MTRVTLKTDSHGDIFYDCENHAGDYDVCTIMSTLSNVLVAAALSEGVQPLEYDEDSGHVRIDIDYASAETVKVFDTVMEVIEQVAEQYPDYVKVY